MSFSSLEEDSGILELQKKLASHRVYSTLGDLTSLKVFMGYHIFAVWDFMSLLKALQRKITCVEVPWRPSSYPDEMVRLINEIVLAEESDLDHEGKASSHFKLYLEGMKEVGANRNLMVKFLEDPVHGRQNLPSGIKDFVDYNLNLAFEGDVISLAASFLYGREKLIPEMFVPIVKVLEKNKKSLEKTYYYFARHIEIDGGEHSIYAKRFLDFLLEGDAKKLARARVVAKTALEKRLDFWDYIDSHISLFRKSRENTL